MRVGQWESRVAVHDARTPQTQVTLLFTRVWGQVNMPGTLQRDPVAAEATAYTLVPLLCRQ